jgi:aspartate kinase
VYTADPRAVPAARQLSVVGYEEMLELANQGAQVMQTRAVELGWVNNVAIEVLSSRRIRRWRSAIRFVAWRPIRRWRR